MHELSIALSVVDVATERAREAGGGAGSRRCTCASARCPGWRSDALRFAFDAACEGTPLDGRAAGDRGGPVAAFCPRCRAERMLRAVPAPVPGLREPTPELVRGTELELTALEVEERCPHGSLRSVRPC